MAFFFDQFISHDIDMSRCFNANLNLLAINLYDIDFNITVNHKAFSWSAG